MFILHVEGRYSYIHNSQIILNKTVVHRINFGSQDVRIDGVYPM